MGYWGEFYWPGVMAERKPKKIEKKYRKYAAESMLKAYDAVREKGVPVQRAALQYGVPEQTLRDRVKGIVNPLSFKQGTETVFTHEEELTLVEHIETMAELGYGITNVQLQHIAGELAYDLGKKGNNKPISNNWLYAFKKRWEHRLASLKPQKLDSNRARSTTPEVLQNYYTNLKQVYDKYELHDKPQNIYNDDETGLQPEHRPPNVIAPINSKPQAITSPRSTTTTLIGCSNAIGNSLPPFFVFKGKRYNPDLMKGANPGAKYEMSETGWSNSNIFRKYVQHHFYPHVKGQASGNEHVLLIYDGHGSLINQTLIT
ncbi:jerky protein homolog-like [Mercenaria mercenaria]|uniref:jerky protein homolog-like n=1 Tax=Mercenaria mercenaria TaxID=6596 RepID=UPI00234E9DD1|nr:jerky protein homolog-like [Mercenaria mercenaria]